MTTASMMSYRGIAHHKHYYQG